MFDPGILGQLVDQSLETSAMTDTPFHRDDYLQLRKVLWHDHRCHVMYLGIRREDVPALLDALRHKFGDLDSLTRNVH